MQNIIESTQKFVQETLIGAEGGHDWFHIERVWRNAKVIAASEPCDRLVVELGALLHDIADSKFHAGDEDLGPRLAGDFLSQQPVAPDVVVHVQNIIRYVSFKGGHNDPAGFQSMELAIVQDADRLDALGAIGIARTFAYGGFKHRPIYDPSIPPNPGMSREEYKASAAPSINHFYEKLLLLKDRMNTPTGRALAQQRHDFMLQFLKQFYNECGQNAPGGRSFAEPNTAGNR